jgi:hypothetical protein
MEFKLTTKEIEKLNKWKKELPEIPVDVFGDDYQFIYKFRPTGLGISIIVERIYDAKEINLTDFDEW